MLKHALFLFLVAFGAAAAPLSFYIEPGTGLVAWHTPPVMPDAAALAAAEASAGQAQKRYEQGLADALSCEEAQLVYLQAQTPLIHGEKSHLMHRGRLFKAARQKRQIIEKRHQMGMVGDKELHSARLDDAWLRARQIQSADPDVYADQLKRAAQALDALETIQKQAAEGGVADAAEMLLIEAARGELTLADRSLPYSRAGAQRAALQKVYDELAALMTAREKNGFCEPDAAASAREAARIFRRECVLLSKEVTPEAVAALEEYCAIYAAIIPLLPQLVEKASKEDKRWLQSDLYFAPRWLESLKLELESMRRKLQNKE